MRCFWKDKGGNVALIFALSLIPITFVVGASVDISRMRGERTKLQSSVDTAALAAANLPAGTSDQEVRRTINRFLAANFDGVGELGDVTITRSGSAIRIDAEADVPLTFTSLLGQDSRPVRSTAEATRSFSFFEVVMVLDNSGSMSGYSKIGALKTAAQSLADTLEEAETEPGSVKIGLVPFTIGVNVGTEYANASWMDHDGLSPQHTAQFDSDDVNRFDLFDELGVNWAGCVDTRAYPLDVTDVTATQGNPASLIVPYFAPDEPDTQTGGGYYGPQDVYPNNYLVDWEDSGYGGGGGLSSYDQYICDYYPAYAPYFGIDCSAGGGPEGEQEPWWSVNDDDNSHNAKVARQAYSGKYGNDSDFSGGRGPNYQCNAQPLLPLTDDFDDIEDAIDDMSANGYTNITQGAMWGWRLLSPGAPFTEGAAYDDPTVRKFLIILTDGENNIPGETGGNHNKSIYNPYGYAEGGRLGNVNNHNQIVSEMDDRLEEICENIKDEGIVVYTIAFDINDDDLEEMMDGCATDADRSFDSPNAASLQATFDAIVNDITQLRLSR